MDMFNLKLEMAVPAIGTANMSDKEGIVSLLDKRIEALSSIEKELKAAKDFIDAELLAANEIRRVYKTMR